MDIFLEKNDINSALDLYEEIEKKFVPDMITFSTIIKGLVKNKNFEKAFFFLKKMIISKKYDISIINLYLEGCSDKQNFRYAEDAYKFLSLNNIIPN